MRNRKKEQELKQQIIGLRNKKRSIESELNQKIIDLYIAMGVSVDHAVKMV